MGYVPRIVDEHLARLLSGLPAVAIDGPKAVGKTATASRLAATTIALDIPSEVELLEADPRRLERLAAPILLDEWQRYPPVWDRVRRLVDADASPGRFLLAGSASPSAAIHSGAGRIVRLRMRPMSLAERTMASSAVSLASLFEGDRPTVEGHSTVGLGDYAEEIVTSGFPGIRSLDPDYRLDSLDGYLDALVEHDFAELGHVVRRPAALRAWLTAFAAATSTTASYNTVLDAATPGQSDKPAKTTTIAYRDTLARLWVLDELDAWPGPHTDIAGLTGSPKHHLADPALAARLLHVGAGALVDTPWPGKVRPREGTLLGALFESLVTLSVRVYAEQNRATVSHLRTRGGEHEIDLIVQRDDGRIVALEVKIARAATDRDVRHLAWLRGRLGDRLADCAVVTAGEVAYRRPDGIAVIPAALLGP